MNPVYPMQFEFLFPPKVRFGPQSIDNIGIDAQSFGNRCFLICGKHLQTSGHLARIITHLQDSGITASIYTTVSGEPDVESVDSAVTAARSEKADFVIGIGGGSILDTAKAVAGLLNNPGSVLEYLEGIGSGKKLEQLPVPWLAVPTTAGTGSESTKNAVIDSKKHTVKKSFRHEALFARNIIIDPELMSGTPKNQTAWSGMDAITQLIEAYVSKKATPMTKTLAVEGLRDAPEALRKLNRDNEDIAAWGKLAYAAFLSGVAIANSGLGAAHGMAAALGAWYQKPHGMLCALLLPSVMEMNREVCLHEYARLGRLLTGKRFQDPHEGAQEAVTYIRELNWELSIPSNLPVTQPNAEEWKRLIELTHGNSMSANPKTLNDDEICEVLRKVLYNE